MKLSLMTAAVAVALAGSATAASLVNPAGDASGVRPAVAVDEVGEDITGAWVGQGFVQKDERSKPVRVNCAVEGMQDGDRIGFEGVCRAFLVVKREIGAMLVRSGSTYTGTYKGSNVGIAELEGAETDAGTVDLTMTFPREVNGDREARMVISRPGDGTFTITTEDAMLSGELVTTSEIIFARK